MYESVCVRAFVNLEFSVYVCPHLLSHVHISGPSRVT